MRRYVFLSIALLLPLAACDSKSGTSISFKSDGEGGNTVGGIDGATGKVAIDTPGFKGDFTLPRIQLDAGDFDLNGVHLYPGSKIADLNIDAHDKPGSHDDSGAVKVRFDSPATPEVVRSWFQDRLTKAGFTLKQDGAGLSGTTDEKKPFHLDLAPAGAGHANGTITVSG